MYGFFSLFLRINKKENPRITMNNRITHDGVITKIEGSKVTVQFVQQSACAECHARMLCVSGDTKQRSVVANSYGVTYSVGEQVEVEVTNQLAWTAMLYAFGLPTILALVLLFPAISLCGEMLACAAELAVLAVYYVILYLLREKLDRKVVFVLHRKNNYTF